MTPNQFRKLALETPGAEESSHMSHPDFRIGGKVFATLSQGGDFGVLKLTPDQQQSWCDSHPSVFVWPNEVPCLVCERMCVDLACGPKGLKGTDACTMVD